MAINVSFNGATIYKPGAYSQEIIDLGGGFPLSPAGIVAIFGESASGTPGAQEPNLKNVVYTPDQMPAIVAKYGSGNIVDACSFLFSPATDGAIPSGAQAVYIYKTNHSTQAQLVLGNSYGTVQALAYGTVGNLITYMNVLTPEVPASSAGSVVITTGLGAGLIVKIAINGAAPLSYTVAGSLSPSALVTALNTAFPGLTFSLSAVAPIGALNVTMNAAPNQYELGWGRSFEILPASANAVLGLSAGLNVPALEPSATITINNTNSNIKESATEGGNVVLSLGYNDVGATSATVTINQTNVILTSVGGANPHVYTLPIAAYPSVGALAAGIGALNSAWSANVSNSLYNQLPVSALDEVSGVGALSVSGHDIQPARLKDDAYSVEQFFANSSNVSLIAPIAAPAPPSPLLTAATYGLLANSAITAAVASTDNGDLGVSPGSSVTGTITVSGATNVANAAAAQAQADALAAYNAFLALPATPIAAVLDGQHLGPGIYSTGAASLDGTLTLTGGPNDVFVISTASTLVTGSTGVPVITLAGGALARNVYWLVGSSATLNSANVGVFQGTVLAEQSITNTGGGTVNGRLIALGAAITLSAATTVNVPAPAPAVTPDVGLPPQAATILDAGISLAGGTLGGTPTSEITNALAAFQKIRVNSVVPLFSRDASADIVDGLTDPSSQYTLLGIQQSVKTHLSLTASTKNRSERQGYMSMKDTYVNCKARAGLLNDAREQLLIQDILQVNSLGSILWFQPWALACLVAGSRGGAPIGTPLTFKFMNCSGIRQTAQPMSTPEVNIHEDFDPDTQYDDAIQSGITFLEAPQTGGFRLVVDNTTYGTDANWVYNRGNVLYAADIVAYNFRNQLEDIYVGVKNTVKANEVKNVCEAVLATFLAQGITVSTSDAPNGYKQLQVQIVGNTINIQVTVKLVEGIDFILEQITLQRASSAA